MKKNRAVPAILSLLLALGAGYLLGCSDSVKPPPKHVDQNPETELTFAPIERDTTTFRVHFYWSGYDRDGEVIQFRYAVDADTLLPDTLWHVTTAKDTTILFLVDPIREVRLHVFKIAAEDNDHHIDPTPAQRSFSAKSAPPFSKIEKGPAAFNPLVGPNFTFEWSGIDPDGGETGGATPVDSFEYLLLLLGAVADIAPIPTHPPLPPYDQAYYISQITQAVGDSLPAPHGDWKWIGIHSIKNRFRNATPGEYVFAERAVDLSGASEKNLQFGRNIRHFTVSTKNPGPTLTISSSVLNGSLPPSTGPNDGPRKALQIFEGETISFAWKASATSYGGEVVGYTHALDDTSRFPGLDLLGTGATFTSSQLGPGSHFLFVRAVDDGGLVTNAVIPLLIVHPSFKDPGSPQEVLYVDDSLSPGNQPSRIGNFPSDVEETNWWTLTMLPTLGVPVTEWDTYAQGFAAGEGDLRKAPEPRNLANYTTVIWNVDFNNGVTDPTSLWRTLVGGSYSELSGYLRAGGTLILTGFAVSGNVTSPRTTLYNNSSRGICFGLEFGSSAYNFSYFPRILMGIDGAVPNGDGLRTLGARDFIAAYPTAAGIAAGYDTAQVDRGDTGSGAKWITTASGDPNTNLAPGLPQVDGWNMARNFGCQENPAANFGPEIPSQPIADPIYTYHGVHAGINEEGAQSPREGKVVGIRVQAHALGNAPGAPFNPNGSLGRMVHLAFPIYFLRDPDAMRILQTAFDYVKESPTLP